MNTEYLNSLSGHNQEMAWQAAQEASMPSDAQIEAEAEQAIVVLYEDCDELIHTSEHPFCSDASCPCHHDFEAIHEQIDSPWLDGLLTIEEAGRLFWGEML